MAEELIRYDAGVVDATGKLIAVFTRGTWYRPTANKVGGTDLDVCSPSACATYNILPVTAVRVEVISRKKG